jgi:alanine racemase
MPDYASAFNRAEVNLAALARNYARLRDFCRRPFMAVIKGDAYGHGLIPCAGALRRAGAEDFGVLDIEEALLVKKAHPAANVHVLAGLCGVEQSDKAVREGIVVLVYDLEQIKMLDDRARLSGLKDVKARIRPKIDAGMGRLGFPYEEAESVLKRLSQGRTHLQIEGLATHLPACGDDEAAAQLARFQKLTRLADELFPGPMRHSALASGGVLAHPDHQDGASRLGLMLYGYAPFTENDPALRGLPESRALIQALEPALNLTSRLVQVRTMRKGETVSYDRTFVVPQDMPVGVAPIGYVHGLSRRRSNRGHAVINGQEAPLLGRVCMNLSMYDLSRIQPLPDVGETIAVLGSPRLGADLAGSWQETNAYETLCLFGRLNPRTYLGAD